jgi:uncharacterized damage-inducible protein DinB
VKNASSPSCPAFRTLPPTMIRRGERTYVSVRSACAIDRAVNSRTGWSAEIDFAGIPARCADDARLANGDIKQTRVLIPYPPAMADPCTGRLIIDDFASKFTEIRRESEQAIAQLDADELRRSLDGDVNSIAITMKHVGGNLRSRFADFLTTDGEKPTRDREGEFVDDFPPCEPGRAAAVATWNAGWTTLESTLAQLTDADLDRVVKIRGVDHTVTRALARSLAHMAYHQGQIVLIARILRGPAQWKTISIPRGGTAQRHAEMGFNPGAPRA